MDVRSVTIAYAQSADPVIGDLNLLPRPGEHLGVVGPSGEFGPEHGVGSAKGSRRGRR